MNKSSIKHIRRSQKRRNRKHNKYVEFQQIKYTMEKYEICFEKARYAVRKKIEPFKCEMGYSSCEERRYCDGDC